MVLLAEERGADALSPLILDGVRRTEDQRRAVQARDDLDAQGRLAGARGGHHVQFGIPQVEIQLVKDPFLVSSPRSVEL